MLLAKIDVTCDLKEACSSKQNLNYGEILIS